MKQRLIFFKGQIFFILLICNICPSISNAQFKIDYKKSADIYYAKADYYSAAVYYEKYLEIKSAATLAKDPYFISNKSSNKKEINTTEKSDIKYRIADCYQSLNNYLKAEKWYNEALLVPSEKFLEATFYLGIALRANGKYEESQKQFEKYLSSGKGKNAEEAKIELKKNQFSLDQLSHNDKESYQINKLESLNTTGANYASFWNGKSLYFTSTRNDQSKINENQPYLNRIYQVNQDMFGSNSISKVEIPTAKGLEQGVACFTSSGNRAYYTQWTKKDGKTISTLFTSELKAGVWTAPQKLNEKINVLGYCSQQPFITADDKFLIFSSNRPGGEGKFDLWYAKIEENGDFGVPINLGNKINTTADEQAPFYHQPSETLVFSSNGNIGLGGFDFFKSKGSLTSSWEKSENFGYPVNSSKDDLYFSNKGNSDLLKDALISSDRLSECCLELFSLNKIVIDSSKVTAVIVPKIDTIAKPRIEKLAYFDFDRYVLKEDTRKTLENLAAILNREVSLNLDIVGYTNKIGSESYNIELSKQRALACKEYLISLGIDKNRLNAIGKGKCCVTGDDIKDMRVEFRLILMY
jgi:OmpA-OmpF porin, OOP family